MKSVKQETLSGVKWTAIEKFSVQGIQFLLGLIIAETAFSFRLWHSWNAGHILRCFTNFYR